MTELVSRARCSGAWRVILPKLGLPVSAQRAPTRANYAQWAGRVGGSAQAAAFVICCAVQSRHDQDFFAGRVKVVAGVVRPSALDITHEELCPRIGATATALFSKPTGATFRAPSRRPGSMRIVTWIRQTSDR